MKKTIYEINSEGFMTYRTLEVDINTPYPSNYVDVPLPSDKKGNQLPFWKPKWDGNKWVEARSQSEIDAEKNKPVTPSPIDLVGKRMIALEGELMVVEVINKTMGEQLIVREFENLQLRSEKKASDKKIANLEVMNNALGQQVVQLDMRLLKGGIL